ncbi:hypothetical protein KAM576c_48780 (plasmid) [Enterobacter asburiae]|nr:hypothetical protein KAM576c_48780 [Enterobacter asburiae]
MIITFILNIIVIVSLSALYIIRRREELKKKEKAKHYKIRGLYELTTTKREIKKRTRGVREKRKTLKRPGER